MSSFRGVALFRRAGLGEWVSGLGERGLFAISRLCAVVRGLWRNSPGETHEKRMVITGTRAGEQIQFFPVQWLGSHSVASLRLSVGYCLGCEGTNILDESRPQWDDSRCAGVS